MSRTAEGEVQFW